MTSNWVLSGVRWNIKYIITPVLIRLVNIKILCDIIYINKDIKTDKWFLK